MFIWSSASVMGLSPRVRGNLDVHLEFCVRDGSIPARAGEPRHGTPRGFRLRVYPRARGGNSDGLHWKLRPTRVYPRACGGVDF